MKFSCLFFERHDRMLIKFLLLLLSATATERSSIGKIPLQRSKRHFSARATSAVRSAHFVCLRKMGPSSSSWDSTSVAWVI
jgi:hypothetical protein